MLRAKHYDRLEATAIQFSDQKKQAEVRSSDRSVYVSLDIQNARLLGVLGIHSQYLIGSTGSLYMIAAA